MEAEKTIKPTSLINSKTATLYTDTCIFINIIQIMIIIPKFSPHSPRTGV